jgi:hypothetical protein
MVRRRTNKRKHGVKLSNKRKTRIMKGGFCGCGCSGGGQTGGSVSFYDNGTPKSAIPLNTGYYSNMDPQRMTESSRFMGGRRRKCKKCGKKIRGGFSASVPFQDPLGASSKDSLSAFGTSAGAQYNAYLTLGKSPDGMGSTDLFSGSKPMV